LAGVAVAATLSGCSTTDLGVKGAVLAKLRSDPVVSRQRIAVDADGGVVYLTGTVATEGERDQAIRLARDTSGVREVEANIRVGA
jgi:osmotically-inducible protein OsmY